MADAFSALPLLYMSTLHEIIHENVREGELFEKLDGNWVRCFACGHCCKIPEGRGLQGSLQPRWNAVCALGLCWRRPMRPDREKTLLPCASRGTGLQLRHARL